MSATAAKKSAVLSDSVLEKAKPKTKVAEKSTSKVNDQITTNPFFKVAMNQQVDPTERCNQVAELLVSTGDREQDRANVKAYEDFREWLSAQNTQLAKQTISLTNVDTMSELQSVIKDMNDDLLAFNDLMSPIMEIIDSIYQLRTSGAVVDAFREIKQDEQRQEKISAEIDALEAKVAEADQAIVLAKESKAQASAKRSLFGFGGITSEGQAEIARADIKIADMNEAKAKYRAEIEALKSSAPDASKLGDLAVHKDRLKELLDLSGEENRDRVIALRNAAAKFIETAEERTGSLREQFVDYKDQIERVVDTNSGMKRTYLILNEGMTAAEKRNAELRNGLVAKEDESLLEKSTREEKVRNLDSHISKVKGQQGETLATAADLEQQAVRVNTMAQSAQQQIDTARTLNTQGVSATADRLAVVLSAVSGAALGEASAVAGDTLNAMRDSTNAVAQREVIRVAMGGDRVNEQLTQIADELAELGEVQRTATDISRNSMTEMEERMKTLHESAASMRDSMRAYQAVAAESGGAVEEAEEPAAAASATNYFS